MAPSVVSGASNQSKHGLRLLIGGRLSGPAPVSSSSTAKSDDLSAAVRAARRVTARQLRAMQAAGYGVSTWPREIVSRLAHLDCLTARHLIDASTSDRVEVESARREMRDLQGWLWDGLRTGQRAEVRQAQLRVRIEECELHLPLLCPEYSGEAMMDLSAGDDTLQAALQSVSDAQLERMVVRLGIRMLGDAVDRPMTEAQMLNLLRDEQMIGVLVATLDDNSLELLAALVRDDIEESLREVLAAVDPIAMAVGDESGHAPVDSAIRLQDCGLAFAECPEHGRRLWVPVELQTRLDGVLDVFGL